jgi:hypothetical protein
MKKENEPTAQEKSITVFPTNTLSVSLGIVTQTNESRGDTPVTVKDISLITGIGEGTLPLPLSTCCQYGILQNVYGSGYKPTELFVKINKPTYEDDKNAAIYEALQNPPLYKKLLQEFNGKVLPDEKGFANFLINKFGFKSYAIPKIVKAFYENFREYGAIDSSNKLRFLKPSSKGGSIDVKLPDAEDSKDETPDEQKGGKDNQLYKQPIPLTVGKVAVLEYPKGKMKKEDIETLRMFIKLIQVSEGIPEEKEKNEKE